VESAPEVLALFKTTEALRPTLEEVLAEAHPYEVPEIISIQPDAVAGPYRAWLLESLRQDGL
jgi:periplasmic divalent cation tolerance protein